MKTPLNLLKTRLFLFAIMLITFSLPLRAMEDDANDGARKEDLIKQIQQQQQNLDDIEDASKLHQQKYQQKQEQRQQELQALKECHNQEIEVLEEKIRKQQRQIESMSGGRSTEYKDGKFIYPRSQSSLVKPQTKTTHTKQKSNIKTKTTSSPNENQTVEELLNKDSAELKKMTDELRNKKPPESEQKLAQLEREGKKWEQELARNKATHEAKQKEFEQQRVQLRKEFKEKSAQLEQKHADERAKWAEEADLWQKELEKLKGNHLLGDRGEMIVGSCFAAGVFCLFAGGYYWYYSRAIHDKEVAA